MMVQWRFFLLSGVVALAITGCSSRDSVAASAAAEAQLDFQQGRNTAALHAIARAISVRDDVSEYWITLARINLAMADNGGAFMAYENASGLDRGNAEVLRALAQLALTVNAPDKSIRYADQLLQLNPNDTGPVVMKGQAALAKNDPEAASQFADEVLKKAPQDLGAQILKARILAGRDNYSEAAGFIENTLGAGGDDTSRLVYLKSLYADARDRPHYQLTLKRLADAKPDDAPMQLDYADMLYQTGQFDAADQVIVQTARTSRNNVGAATNILDTWLKEGPDALSPAAIQSQSRGASLEIKAAYAQFANEIGHPELASAILGNDLQNKAVSTENANAQAALAYAQGLLGHRTTAMARLTEILQFDQFQPRALLARARLRMADKDMPGAVEDARNAVAQEPLNATARLFLFDALSAQSDSALAQQALREAMRAMPGDVRIAARLATVLAAKGQQGAAREVLRDLMRASPVSLRAQRLQQSLDPSAVQTSRAPRPG